MTTRTELLGHFDAQAIARVVTDLERMKASRRDYIWPAARLRMASGELFMEGKTFKVTTAGDGGSINYTTWEDAEAAADRTGGKLEVAEAGGSFPLTRPALAHICDNLEIPHKYLTSLRERGQDGLADHNVTTLLKADQRKFLVRTLADTEQGSRVRAVLGDGYRIMDNADLFFCAAETFQERGVDIWKARLWGDGDGFELFGVAPQIRGQVRLDRTFDPGDGWMSRWKGQDGDVQNAAVRISNSETGNGGLCVRMCILTRVCANFCVWGNAITKVHVGRRREEEGLVLSEDTQALEAELLWKKVRDAIRTAFDPEKFRAYIDRLNGLTQQALPEPETAVDNVVKAYTISEARKAAILGNLLANRDLSRYGLVQAVTATAHQADREGRAEEASTLEEVGGKLVALADGQFAALVR